MWNLISAGLQLAAIYLVGQGGIALSLAGFRPREVNPAKKELRFWLTFVAFIALCIILAIAMCSLVFAEAFSRPHFIGPQAEQANEALWDCLRAPRAPINRGVPDGEMAAFESLTRYRECVNAIKGKFDVEVVYEHSLTEFFWTHARLTAAVVGLVFLVPGLVYFSTRLRPAKHNENKTRQIVVACAELYAGILLQVFLEIADRFGAFLMVD